MEITPKNALPLSHHLMMDYLLNISFWSKAFESLSFFWWLLLLLNHDLHSFNYFAFEWHFVCVNDFNEFTVRKKKCDPLVTSHIVNKIKQCFMNTANEL